MQLAKSYHHLSYLYFGISLLGLIVAIILLFMKNDSALKIDKGEE